MAKEKVDKMAKLAEEINIPEALLCGGFWAKPELYDMFPETKINTQTLFNPIWKFYFGLGRHMYSKDVKSFDDFTTFAHVKQLGLEAKYEKYGGFQTMQELMGEASGFDTNIDSYYAEVKKYNLLRKLQEQFGDVVLEKDGNYDYRKMTRGQINTYWQDRVNKIFLDEDNTFQEAFLLQGLRERIKQWNETPHIGLEFYLAKQMTQLCNGWDYGNVYIHGAFGGRGKTSFMFAKVIMSCIKNHEKLLLIANEQDVEEFQKMLLISVMGAETHDYFERKRINEGHFDPKEEEMLEKAVKKVEEMISGKDQLVAVVFMESYTIDNVKQVVAHYARRGYRSVVIDTGKPSDDLQGMARWERFTEDFKEIYKLAKPQSFNLRVWINVQLADSALNQRYLNEFSLGDSKKIKNEASVVFLQRGLWDDEYAGEKNQLEVYNWIPDENSPTGYTKNTFTLQMFDERGNKNQYVLLFVSKNRRGQDNNTGLDVLVLKPNFNNNTWKEIGWTKVYKDFNY